MIGDYVYAIVNQPVYINDGKVDLPTISFDKNIMSVPASSIYYINASDYYYAFVKILAINIQNPAQEPTYETLLLDSLSNVYVSQKNIYITLPGKSETTNIQKIGIEDDKITYTANGTVPGRVLNQFSMDESNDYFRIATTKGWSTTATSNVYILNQQLSIVGKLEGLAPGESIYSARFMGERCYLVTFQKVDPLFVIDLTELIESTPDGKYRANEAEQIDALRSFIRLRGRLVPRLVFYGMIVSGILASYIILWPLRWDFRDLVVIFVSVFSIFALFFEAYNQYRGLGITVHAP